MIIGYNRIHLRYTTPLTKETLLFYAYHTVSKLDFLSKNKHFENVYFVICKVFDSCLFTNFSYIFVSLYQLFAFVFQLFVYLFQLFVYQFQLFVYISQLFVLFSPAVYLHFCAKLNTQKWDFWTQNCIGSVCSFLTF